MQSDCQTCLPRFLRLVPIVAVTFSIAACQTPDRSSNSKFSAEFKSIRADYSACTDQVSRDPAIQIIKEKTPLQPKSSPSQAMKAGGDMINDQEITAMDRYQTLLSPCRDNLIKASGAIDPRYNAVLETGFAEQDKLAEALKKRQDNWGAYNVKYQQLKIEVNEKIASIDKDLQN